MQEQHSSKCCKQPPPTPPGQVAGSLQYSVPLRASKPSGSPSMSQLDAPAAQDSGVTVSDASLRPAQWCWCVCVCVCGGGGNCNSTGSEKCQQG